VHTHKAREAEFFAKVPLFDLNGNKLFVQCVSYTFVEAHIAACGMSHPLLHGNTSSLPGLHKMRTAGHAKTICLVRK
jgi:hypothetical protein